MIIYLPFYVPTITELAIFTTASCSFAAMTFSILAWAKRNTTSLVDAEPAQESDESEVLG